MSAAQTASSVLRSSDLSSYKSTKSEAAISSDLPE